MTCIAAFISSLINGPSCCYQCWISLSIWAVLICHILWNISNYIQFCLDRSWVAFFLSVFLCYKVCTLGSGHVSRGRTTSCVWIGNCASVLWPAVVKLTVPDANITSLPQFLLLLNLEAVSLCDSCIPSGPTALPVASLSRQAGAALLILFYLRAPLNINAFLSLNYSLTGLPTHSAFVYLPLFHSSTFPPVSAFSTLSSLSTPKVNF